MPLPSASVLKMLACPVCWQMLAMHGDMDPSPSAPPCVRCTGCGLHYPIVDGIPALIAGRAFKDESA